MGLIMKIEIDEATREDATVVERLLQLYQYEFSEILGGDAEADGVYRFVSVDDLWGDPDGHVFIARVDGHLAGFAVVIERSHFTGAPDVTYMDEFVIMRKMKVVDWRDRPLSEKRRYMEEAAE